MTAADFSCQPEDISNLFGCLFPVKVDIVPAEQEEHMSAEKIVGIFRNDVGELVGVCNADFEFAARAAAALTMIPSGGCNEAIENKELSESYLENTHEVMNLMATLISEPGGKRVFLSDLVVPGQPIPDDVVTLLETYEFCAGLKASFQGYGEGVFTFLG